MPLQFTNADNNAIAETLTQAMTLSVNRDADAVVFTISGGSDAGLFVIQNNNELAFRGTD